jgi:broad specificity phosphatase PhoE
VLILARHGRTEANARGVLLGRTDPPLDELGVQQAAALRSAVAGAARVVCSPLQRCRQTAEALGLPVTVDERWIELDYGELDGVALRDVPADLWARWTADLSFAPPGGESLEAVGSRVRAACDDLAEECAARDVVVVTHVSPLKAAAAWALGVGDSVTWHLYAAPAAVSRIATGGPRRSLHLWNSTAHLEGVAPGAGPGAGAGGAAP